MNRLTTTLLFIILAYKANLSQGKNTRTNKGPFVLYMKENVSKELWQMMFARIETLKTYVEKQYSSVVGKLI